VDVVRSLSLQLIDQVNVMVIELMVPRHIDHGPVREPVFRPTQAFYTHADITCQYHDIGVSRRRLEVLELDVQIIEDLDPHWPNLSIDMYVILFLMVVGNDLHA